MCELLPNMPERKTNDGFCLKCSGNHFNVGLVYWFSKHTKSNVFTVITFFMNYADFPPPKRSISQVGELRKEYEEELKKVK